MKPKHPHAWRLSALAGFMLLICLVYTAKLVNIQIASRDQYAEAQINTYKRTVKIQAHRGEIFDRNGTPLVTNEIRYSLILDYAALPYGYAASNEVILEALAALERTGESNKRTAPVSPFSGTYPDLSYQAELLSGASAAARHARILADNACEADISAADFIAFLAQKYKLVDSNGTPLYDNETMTTLLAIRYDMEYIQFSSVEPYVLATDVSLELITYVKEQQITGADFLESVTRQYAYPGYASHILGLVGKIQTQEALEYYTALGYPMDAMVGISGVEEAFENYLHGQDGELTIVEDEDGNIVDRYVSREPVAGKMSG